MDEIKVERTYPLSVMDGVQSGGLFVDDADEPRKLLFWHRCGFAMLAGNVDDAFASEALDMMREPSEEFSSRMALQAPDDAPYESVFLSDSRVTRYVRYVLEFTGNVNPLRPDSGTRVVPIDRDNYDLFNGRIVPSFSWDSREAFLEKGFGLLLMHRSEVLAGAFSSALSRECCDIGIETMEPHRGHGYAKTIAAAMVLETLKRGLIPVWDCDTRNIGSLKTAQSCGFEICGTHPWYKYE